MSLYFDYPHTDLNKQNLDWLVSLVKQISTDWEKTKQDIDIKIGAFDGITGAAESVPYSEEARVIVTGGTGEGDPYDFLFKIPRGIPTTIDNTVIQYAQSNQGTNPNTVTGWQNSIPSIIPGNFLWTRTTITWSGESGSAVVYGVSRQGVDGSGSVATVNGYVPDTRGNVQLPLPSASDEAPVQLNSSTGSSGNSSEYSRANHRHGLAYATTNPLPNGIANTGSTSKISRSDHVHPAMIASVLTYGADPNGNTNSTTAFNNALSNNHLVFVPAGTYKLDPFTIPEGCTLFGEGSASSLQFTGSANFITVSDYAGIDNLQLDNIGNTQSSEHAIKVEGNHATISNVKIYGFSGGVKLLGVLDRLFNVFVQGASNFTVGIEVNGGDASDVITNCTVTSDQEHPGSYGILVSDSSALTIEASSFLWCDIGIGIVNDVGNVFSLNATDCFFDNSPTNAAVITSNCYRINFINCWFAGQPSVTANVIDDKGSCNFSNCTICFGVNGIVTMNNNSAVNNCAFGNVTTGISINGGSRIKVFCSRFDNVYDFVNSPQYALYVNQACPKIILIGNEFKVNPNIVGFNLATVHFASGNLNFTP
ncbi:MAG: hypothetical protein KBS70_05790 [Bacteroidales bacterium]|nr:hypothetical protein [Candidatus Colicola equi]